MNPSDWLVSFSGDCDADGQVTVENDQSKTCTVTNSKRPILNVIKNVVGGLKTPGDFQLSVSGN